MVTKEKLQAFKKRFPLIARLADAIEAKGMIIVWDEPQKKEKSK